MFFGDSACLYFTLSALLSTVMFVPLNILVFMLSRIAEQNTIEAVFFNVFYCVTMFDVFRVVSIPVELFLIRTTEFPIDLRLST